MVDAVVREMERVRPGAGEMLSAALRLLAESYQSGDAEQQDVGATLEQVRLMLLRSIVQNDTTWAAAALVFIDQVLSWHWDSPMSIGEIKEAA